MSTASTKIYDSAAQRLHACKNHLQGLKLTLQNLHHIREHISLLEFFQFIEGNRKKML